MGEELKKIIEQYEKPIYSTGWFNKNIPHWLEDLKEFKGKECHYLEIGAWEGRATRWMLENILTHKDSTATAIDTFEGGMEHEQNKFKGELSSLQKRFIHNLSPFVNKVKIRIGYSQKVLRKMSPEPTYDIIYIDGSHTAYDTLEDAILSFRLLKEGGIMIFDDYGWRRYKNEVLNPPLGIDAFLTVFEGQYEVVRKWYQVAIRKVKPNINDELHPNKQSK